MAEPSTEAFAERCEELSLEVLELKLATKWQPGGWQYAIANAVAVRKRREGREADRPAALDQGAEQVGHADNANRIARRVSFISAAALIISLGALIASLTALSR